MWKEKRVSVVFPCYNEEISIAQTVEGFQKNLPFSKIYVYDNNSTDQTIEAAKKSGAIVRGEKHQGKGNVVRRMFADVEADIYVLCDGDNTYDSDAAPTLIQKLIDENLDMVVAARQTAKNSAETAYRTGHRFGNKLFTKIVEKLFGKTFEDILSGYRIFSRRFVKTFPSLSCGFDIETELTIHSLEMRLPAAEIKTPYYARPLGSFSKLCSYRDGWLILRRILSMLKETRPLFFFGTLFILLALTSILFSIPVFITFFKTGLVPKFPTAVLSVGLMLIAFISLTCGMILDSIRHKHQELKRLHYLNYKSVTKKDENVNENDL